MRTRTALLPIAASAALLLAACSSSADTSDSATAGVQLVNAGELTMCTNPTFEPFEYKDDDGEITGLDPAIIGEVAADLGVELTIKSSPFEGLQSGADLDTGNCDIVASGMTITPEREEKFDFSEPYFDANLGLLVAEGSGIDSLTALDGKTIGVQQASTGEEWAQKNGLNAIQFEDLGLQIQALKTGQVNAVVNDVAVLGPYLSDGYEMTTTFTTGDQYGFGVKQGNTALLDQVNATVDRITSDGTYDALYTEFIGQSPTQTASAAPAPSDN